MWTDTKAPKRGAKPSAGTVRKSHRKVAKAKGEHSPPARPELFAGLDDSAAQRQRMADEAAGLDALAPIDAVADLVGMMAGHIELFSILVDETQKRIAIARANKSNVVDEPAGIRGAVERFNFLAAQYNSRIDGVWQTIIDTRINKGMGIAECGSFKAETATEIVATIFFDRLGCALRFHSRPADCGKDEGVARILHRHKFSADPAAVLQGWPHLCWMLGDGAPWKLPASLADLIPQLKLEFRAAAMATGKTPDRPAGERLPHHGPHHHCDEKFRSVTWGNREITFTQKQAEHFEVLFKAWANKTPDVQQSQVCKDAGYAAARLIDVFTSNHVRNPAWGKIIFHREGAARGTLRLIEPDDPRLTDDGWWNAPIVKKNTRKPTLKPAHKHTTAQ